MKSSQTITYQFRKCILYHIRIISYYIIKTYHNYFFIPVCQLLSFSFPIGSKSSEINANFVPNQFPSSGIRVNLFPISSKIIRNKSILFPNSSSNPHKVRCCQLIFTSSCVQTEFYQDIQGE